MSRNIRLFPTYSQGENQTTNHCMLILKMMYEENPKFLSEVLSTLLDSETISGAVGVQFQQQKGSKQSTPDGEITQEPFSILIETKHGDWFDENQLLNHLSILQKRQGDKVLIALGQGHRATNNFVNVENQAQQQSTSFVKITFEEFLQALQLSYLSKNLADAIGDLGEYFEEQNLLPSWKYRLDVVNCSGTFNDVLANKAYYCPAKGGAYHHRHSLYFGMYRHKRVEYIAEIEAVIDLDSDDKDEASIVWSNCGLSDDALKDAAIARRQKLTNPWYPIRIFILGNLFPTDFLKTTSGGMFGSKKYFDIRALNVTDAQDLANQLQGKTWEQL